MESSVLMDPGSKSPPQWQSRLAALLGHGRKPDDPDVIECREALAYWRCRRVIDAEVDQIGPAGVERLIEALRRAVAR
ncbi:hypothetical protein L2K20_06105 [Mycobacterium sp. MBM]|nr:hypothetical protein [Mycobacterium sp. MBM]